VDELALDGGAGKGQDENTVDLRNGFECPFACFVTVGCHTAAGEPTLPGHLADCLISLRSEGYFQESATDFDVQS
jgi:hypothetical protein